LQKARRSPSRRRLPAHCPRLQRQAFRPCRCKAGLGPRSWSPSTPEVILRVGLRRDHQLGRPNKLYLVVKAFLSGVIIMAASEIAKRSPTSGSLILSLPLISILAFIWLWRDTGEVRANEIRAPRLGTRGAFGRHHLGESDGAPRQTTGYSSP